MGYRFEPTTLFLWVPLLLLAAVLTTGMVGGGEVYPGSAWLGGVREGYTGTHPYTLPGHIYNLFLRLSPTHGQMKVFFSKMMRFLR